MEDKTAAHEMNRRRFLKYAGATAAVVGGSVLGFTFLQRIPFSSSQQTTTTVPSSTGSMSTSTVRHASLQGRLFFDYNGNGKQDGEEQTVSNARVQFIDKIDSKIVAETITDSSGDYNVDIPAGNYKLVLQPDDSKFRYMCTSPEEFRAIQTGYDLTVIGDVRFDVGLMEGFLTMPFSHDVNYVVNAPYDHDPAIGRILWWNQTGQCASVDKYCHSSIYGNTDNHSGIDYAVQTGTPILAAAPGKVFWTGPSLSTGSGIIIQHPIKLDFNEKLAETLDNEQNRVLIFTGYFHLSSVAVHSGQDVKRGEVIGFSGQSGTYYPHLHFSLYSQSSDKHWAAFDPYKPIVNVPEPNGFWIDAVSSVALWKVEYNPANNRNSWTVFNKPQFCS